MVLGKVRRQTLLRKECIVMNRRYPEIDMLRTGQNIRNIMKSKGYSVREVQRFLKLGTPQSIYHWFDGRNLPTIDNIYALSELFDMPIDALVVGNKGYVNRRYNNMCHRLTIYLERLIELKAV